MTIAVRRATLADLPSLLEHEQSLFGSDAWSDDVFRAELAHTDSYYLVGVDVEQIVGYAGLRAPLAGADQGDIQTLAVVPSHRGRGLGRALLHALLEEATRRGIHEVFLEVRADNPVAISLYGTEGFREISRRRGYYQPDGIDALVMRCVLADRVVPERNPSL